MCPQQFVLVYQGLNSAFRIKFRNSFDSEKQTKRLYGVARFVGKI